MKKLSYVIVIQQHHYASTSANLAYQIAEEILRQGHQITQIFFMQNGVYHANKYINIRSDETDLTAQWQKLSALYHIPLRLCITASECRGIVAENLASGFELSGLGEFSQHLFESDRVLTF